MADRDQSPTSNRGFASMDEKRQRDIASKGGQASGGNFANDPERPTLRRKGGHSVPAEERSFSKDHELAAEAGRKGGKRSHGGQTSGSHQGGQAHGGHPRGGHQGGPGNFAEDRERASEAGRKGRRARSRQSVEPASTRRASQLRGSHCG
jgi:general stress protein YciG